LGPFTEPKAMVENQHYQDQRQKSLASLHDGMIDEPKIELINAFNKLPYCFIYSASLDISSMAVRTMLIT